MDEAKLLIEEAAKKPSLVTTGMLQSRCSCSIEGSADFGMLAREQATGFNAEVRKIRLANAGSFPVSLLWLRVVVPTSAPDSEEVFALRCPSRPGVIWEKPEEHSLGPKEVLDIEVLCMLKPGLELGIRHALIVAAMNLKSSVDVRQMMISSSTFLLGTRAVVIVGSSSALSALRSDATPFYPEQVRNIWHYPPARYFPWETGPRRPLAVQTPLSHLFADYTFPWPLPPQARRGQWQPIWGRPEGYVPGPRRDSLVQGGRGDPRLASYWRERLIQWTTKWTAHLEELLHQELKAMLADFERMDMFFVRVQQTHHRTESGIIIRMAIPGLEEKRPALAYGSRVHIRPAGAPHYLLECWVVDPSKHSQVLLCAPSALAQMLEGRPCSGMVHVRFHLDWSPVHNMMFASATYRKQLLGNCAPCALVTRRATRAAPARDATDPVRGVDLAWVNTDLNAEQRDAVARCVRLPDASSSAFPCLPHVVWGPPGTGKTSMVCEAVLQCLLAFLSGEDPSGTTARVLVCAPSNGAADTLLERLADHGKSLAFRMHSGDKIRGPQGKEPSWLHRFNSFRRPLGEMNAALHGHACIDNAQFSYMSFSEYRRTPVIVCTCMSAFDLGAIVSRFTESSQAGRELHLQPEAVRGYFTHVIIDEAAQALEPETYLPIILGRHSSDGGCRVSLVGDHRQLGPIVRSQEARGPTDGLHVSLLQRLMGAYNADGHLGVRECSPILVTQRTADVHYSMLKWNYRSHKALLELPSSLYYEGKLVAKSSDPALVVPDPWAELAQTTSPFLFYGIAGQQLSELDSPSLFNPSEAAKVVQLVVSYVRTCSMSTDDIGVIALFRKQAVKLRRLLRDEGLGSVRVGSVDDIQGREERVVIISTVVSGAGATRGDHLEYVVRSPERFNVAITRARALLIVVGDANALMRYENWRKLILHARKSGCYRGPPIDEALRGEGEVLPGQVPITADEDQATMLSRVAARVLEPAAAGGVSTNGADTLDNAFELEWRLMI